MKAGETRRVAGMAGDNIVQAIGKTGGGTWRRVVRADGSEQRAVLIDLQGAQQQQASRPTAPSTRVNPADGLTYIWIAPGTFQIGCSRGDSDCFGPEKPAHAVTITK